MVIPSVHQSHIHSPSTSVTQDSFIHSLTQLLTQSFTPSLSKHLSHSVTHSQTHSVTHSHSHLVSPFSVTHSVTLSDICSLFLENFLLHRCERTIENKNLSSHTQKLKFYLDDNAFRYNRIIDSLRGSLSWKSWDLEKFLGWVFGLSFRGSLLEKLGLGKIPTPGSSS